MINSRILESRYCKRCYIQTEYACHLGNIPWSYCHNCKKMFHLYETIGETRYIKNLENIRDERLFKILNEKGNLYN